MDNVAPEIMALIPARGGSKGVPRKNLRLLHGKPLIAWTIEKAKACSLLKRVIVSTDDDEIAATAKSYGAEVPFLRPAEHAQDQTPDLPVYRHALSWLQENDHYQPDIVVWLRPTVPLRAVDDITKAIRVLTESDFDSVRSVCRSAHHPYWMKRLEGEQLVSFVDGIDETQFIRQALPPVYLLNGAVDVISCQKVAEHTTLFGQNIGGYVMPEERSVDIDTEHDFKTIEMLLQEDHS